MKAIPLPDPRATYPDAKWDYTGRAMAINNKGIVAGCFGSPNPRNRAFVWSASNGFIDIHPPGDGSTCATAINGEGVVAGSADFWGRMGFTWKQGGKVEFLPLTSGAIQINGINEAGDVVGSVTPFGLTNQPELAFVWNAHSGALTLTSAYGGPVSRALDINDAGQVVGFDSKALTAGVVGAMPVLWQTSTGVRSDLASPLANGCTWQPDNGVEGDCAAAAVAINNSGEIAGTVGGRAFRWVPEAGLTTLELPNGRSSSAVGINASGDIAGTAILPDQKTRIAFVWKRTGEVIELGAFPGLTSSVATGINDLGQVVGYGQ